MESGDIDRRAKSLYGEVDWRAATGVLHVAAIHGPSNRIIAIGPRSPASETDRFVLGLARARADVIVTTAGILRSEPDLVHRYAETDAEDAAFAAWRAETLGRAETPRLLVLSATGRFAVDHPALATARGWIWTTPSGAAAVGDPPSGFEVVSASATAATTQDAVAFAAMRDRGDGPGATVTLEAGPATTAPLYADARPIVDELLSSRFEGELDPAAEGPAFVPVKSLDRPFGAASSEARVDEPSGPWTFARHRRRDYVRRDAST